MNYEKPLPISNYMTSATSGLPTPVMELPERLFHATNVKTLKAAYNNHFDEATHSRH
ncbi:MAG: hypothetical protein GY765_18315 [bacterium]|nr:hypothetical protein [bacterium]